MPCAYSHVCMPCQASRQTCWLLWFSKSTACLNKICIISKESIKSKQSQKGVKAYMMWCVSNILLVENKHTHITLYIGYMHSTYKFIPDEYFMTGFLVKEGERERPFLQGRMWESESEWVSFWMNGVKAEYIIGKELCWLFLSLLLPISFNTCMQEVLWWTPCTL